MIDLARLPRSRNKMVAGLCAGIARDFEVPVTRVRIGYVVLTVLMLVLPGVLAYLALWYLLPEE
jgi:phage shock protein PspC (stress-responsive transcriptional regulator)